MLYLHQPHFFLLHYFYFRFKIKAKKNGSRHFNVVLSLLIDREKNRESPKLEPLGFLVVSAISRQPLAVSRKQN
jgi:hypothetical protein